MSTSMPGEEDESVSFEIADEEFVGGLPEGGFNLDPLSVLETVDVVEAGAAYDADCVFCLVGHGGIVAAAAGRRVR